MKIIPIDPSERSRYTLAQYILSGVHDGYLKGVMLCEPEELHLTFTNLGGEKYRLVVPCLDRLKADNFLQGNIVLDVGFYEAQSCPDYILRQAYGYDEEAAGKYLPVHLQKMNGQPWTVLEISSSYGCELVAVFNAPVEAAVVTAL